MRWSRARAKRRRPRSGTGDLAAARAADERLERRSAGRASAFGARWGRRSSHSVYVVELRPAAAKLPSDSTSCVYVGMTGLPIRERFRNHLRGYKASRVVTRYGRRLRPELYEHLNPMSYEEALRAERAVAEDLRCRGFTVFGGH